MSFFRKKKKIDLTNIIIGFYRVETAKLLGVEPNTDKYSSLLQQMSSGIGSPDFLNLFDKKLVQNIHNSHLSISNKRSEEMLGEFFTLIFVRFSISTVLIEQGKVKREEATPNVLINNLHEQLKNIVKQYK